MGTRVKYSLQTRKLRVYHPGSPPDFWEDVKIIRLGQRAWFLWIRPDLEDQLGLLQEVPRSPYEVQEISFLLRQLKKLQPVLVLDLPGWRNPRENPRTEWLAVLRELDKNLAQKIRQFISGEGKREYLKQDSRD
jgi:hypothetical protein